VGLGRRLGRRLGPPVGLGRRLGLGWPPMGRRLGRPMGPGRPPLVGAARSVPRRAQRRAEWPGAEPSARPPTPAAPLPPHRASPRLPLSSALLPLDDHRGRRHSSSAAARPDAAGLFRAAPARIAFIRSLHFHFHFLFHFHFHFHFRFRFHFARLSSAPPASTSASAGRPQIRGADLPGIGAAAIAAARPSSLSPFTYTQIIASTTLAV